MPSFSQKHSYFTIKNLAELPGTTQMLSEVLASPFEFNLADWGRYSRSRSTSHVPSPCWTTYLWRASGHRRVAFTHSLSRKPILNITSTTERAFIFMSCARTRLGCAVPSSDIFDLTLTYYRDWIIGLTMVREWTTDILVVSFICCVYELINYTSIGML